MLQFITDYSSKIPVTDQLRAVISGGCRWVEIKMDGAGDDEISKTVEEIMPLCIETETFLLLAGHVELAKKLNVGGVHLYPHDELPSKARIVLGAAAVIGATASSLDQIKAVRSLDVDYIALCPYSSESDKNASLGLEGVRELIKEMQRLEITINTVAQGGIRTEDVVPLMESGVNGLAVSKSITSQENLEEATNDYVKALEIFMPK